MLAAQPIMVGRICFRFIQLEIIRQTSTPPILQTRTQAEASLPATGRSSSSAIRRKTLSSSNNSNKCLRMLLKWFMPVSHRIRYPHTMLSKLKCSIRMAQPPAAVNEEETLPCRTPTRPQIGQSQSSSPPRTSSSSRLTVNLTCSQAMNPISNTVTSRLLIAVRRHRHRPRSRARSSLRPPSARS